MHNATHGNMIAFGRSQTSQSTSIAFLWATTTSLNYHAACCLLRVQWRSLHVGWQRAQSSLSLAQELAVTFTNLFHTRAILKEWPMWTCAYHKYVGISPLCWYLVHQLCPSFNRTLYSVQRLSSPVTALLLMGQVSAVDSWMR